jgi:hypothetical protein
MTKPPLTPEQKEEYARRLKASIKTRRPLKGLRMAVALVVVIAAAGLLWHFARPPADSPPVALVCLDGVGCVGQPIRTRAWLRFVEGPGKVGGLSVHWSRSDQTADPPISKADEHGLAETESPPTNAESVLSIQATLREPQERRDRGRVFVHAPHKRIVIVPIAPMTSAHVLPNDHELTPAEIGPVSAWKKAGWRIVYAVTTDDPIEYLRLRGWVRSQSFRGLPDGPVLLSRETDATKAIPEVVRQTLADSVMLWSPEVPK